MSACFTAGKGADMGDTSIKYEQFSIETFRREIVGRLGEAFWENLTEPLTLPDINTEHDCKCRNMVLFMKRFEALADKEDVKEILCCVRHGLHPSQSEWAREEYLKTGDIDLFLKNHLEKELQHFAVLNRDKKDFYGQEITDEVLEFVRSNPSMLSPERRGRYLYCKAFPCSMKEYLAAEDAKMKRYYACHCPFAKESILSDETVSPTLCNCSLGHVMNFAEAFLGQKLKGRVIRSVLNGDLSCEYEIKLPEEFVGV